MDKLGITQEQMAERLGVTQGAVGHWLTGRREPKLIDINRLLGAVGLPPLAVADEMYNVQPAPQQPAQLRAAALAAIASPRSQEVLARIAKAAEDGRLTEDDLLLLERIAARFEQAPTHAPAPERGSNTRLRERLRKNDPNAQQ